MTNLDQIESFVPGTKALSSQVNQNFQLLKDACISLSSLTGRLKSTKRHCILSTYKTYSGTPAHIENYGGLGVLVYASNENPLVLSFADGFDSNLGAVDYISVLKTELSLYLMDSNMYYYIYIERDPETGELSLNSTNKKPVYSAIKPLSALEGDHWFSTIDYKMYCYNGGYWEAKQRVFIGEAETQSSIVTNIIPYNNTAKAQINWFSVTNNTLYTKNLNLGLSPEVQNVTILGRKDSNYNAMPINSVVYNLGLSKECGAVYSLTNNQVKIKTANDSVLYPKAVELETSDVTVNATGEYQITIERSF